MSPSKELTQRRWELVHPSTGEILTADSSDETLATYLDWLADLKALAQEHKSVIDQEILARMDEDAAWTKHAGEYKLVGQSPAPVTEYDKERLAETLNDLVSRELVSAEAATRALKIEVVHKPQKSGINALLKLGGEVAERIRECVREVPRDRRSVRVTRSGR